MKNVLFSSLSRLIGLFDTILKLHFTIYLFDSMIKLSLNSMEKLRFFAEEEPSKLSESFLVVGVTFLDKTYLKFT